jgi:hypothetical protein
LLFPKNYVRQNVNSTKWKRESLQVTIESLLNTFEVMNILKNDRFMSMNQIYI